MLHGAANTVSFLNSDFDNVIRNRYVPTHIAFADCSKDLCRVLGTLVSLLLLPGNSQQLVFF